MTLSKYVPSVTKERVEFTLPFIGGLAFGPQVLAAVAFDPLTWVGSLLALMGLAGVEETLGSIPEMYLIVLGIAAIALVVVRTGGD